MSAADPRLLERLRRRLRAGDTVSEAARACGVTTDKARGLIVRHGREAGAQQPVQEPAKSPQKQPVSKLGPPPPPLATEPELPGPRPGCCCWPDGEKPRLRFDCRSPPLPGRPYCAVHARRAFQHAPARTGTPIILQRLVSTL